MKSARFQTLGTNKKVIIVHPQTRYWSPVERTLKLFLTFFLKEKIQTRKTVRPFVPVPFRVFLRGRFSKFFWFNRTSKIGAVEGVRKNGRKPERQPCTIFTTPGAMWYGVKMCGKAYGVRSCYDGRGMCTTLPENLDHVVLLLFFVN